MQINRDIFHLKIKCMIERLKIYIDSKGISVSSFEQKISASDGMIRRAVRNGTDIQSRWIENISDNYPDLNLIWLITGKGSMINKTMAEKEEQSKEINAAKYTRGIPLIPVDAFAGFGSENSKSVLEVECDHYIIPNLKDAEFLIQVRGSSMFPKYSSGDIVACKKLPLDTFFQWNKVYVVDTEQGVLIKRVRRSDIDDHISLASDNEQFEPFDIHRKHIRSLAIVVGVIRLE